MYVLAGMRSHVRARAPLSPSFPLPPASVKGSITENAAAIAKRLWDGGLGRAEPMSTGARKAIAKWEDVVLIYAGQRMQNTVALQVRCRAPQADPPGPGRYRSI